MNNCNSCNFNDAICIQKAHVISMI